MEAGQSANDAEFAQFARIAYRSLLRTTRLLTGDPHAAENLAQAALRVYLHWEWASTWESPHACTHKVVVNLYATSRRRRWHTDVPYAAAQDRVKEGDMAHGADDKVELAYALHRLPRSQRTVLVLRFYEDLSVEEAAKLLGCSPGTTVKSRTNRALERLRIADALTGYAEGSTQ